MRREQSSAPGRSVVSQQMIEAQDVIARARELRLKAEETRTLSRALRQEAGHVTLFWPTDEPNAPGRVGARWAHGEPLVVSLVRRARG